MPLNSPYGNVQIIDKPFHDIVLESIKQHSIDNPTKVALIDNENGKKYTFDNVYNLSYRLATSLHNIGMTKGDGVLICLPNCVEYALITFGVALRGGVISGINATYTQYEIKRQMKDCGCKFVFTMDFLLDKISKAAAGLNGQIKHIIAIRTDLNHKMTGNVIDFSDMISTKPDENLASVQFDTKHDLFALPYSSGTTGPAKGVMLSHYNFAAMTAVHYDHYQRFEKVIDGGGYNRETEVCIVYLPFFHVFGFGLLMYYLRLGITLVTMAKFDPEEYLKLIQKHKPTFIFVVPPIALFLAKHPVVSEFDISSVQYVICGAAPLGKELSVDLKRRHPNMKEVFQAFGMTETTAISHLPWPNSPNGCSGLLAANMKCKIVDPETGKELGPNQNGEVWLCGPNIMLGYLNRPQATAETIDKDGWLHTGDIGYYDDKEYLYAVDRLKELIKVKGFQVPPAELEDILVTHPAIQDCAVIGIPDTVSGELPRAYVVLKNGQKISENKVQKFLEDKVAHYKWLKGGVEFVTEIPKSPSGKILRRLLKEKVLSKL